MARTSATKPRAGNLKFELEAWTQIPDSSRFTFMTLGKSLLFFWDSICLLKNGDKKKSLGSRTNAGLEPYGRYKGTCKL